MSGFMGKNYYNHKTITISLKKFEERLQETRFSDIPLKTIVEQYEGKPLISKKAKREQEETLEEEFFQKIQKENENKASFPVLKTMLEGKANHFLKIQYKKDAKKLKQALENACDCYNQLPKQKTKLPVFSAKVLKNPHGLDKNTLTGQIFAKLLARKESQKLPKDTEELSELYFHNNLLVDDVSNMVLCKNIKAYTKIGEHLAWKGFFEENEAMQATLENLSKIEKLEISYDYALVMENPAVFTEIAERLQEKRVPIVCTYGQVKLSGILLLKLLANSCKTIFYSGDIDPEGIQIADKLKTRFPDKIQLIGFHANTYYQNLSEVRISNERLQKLDKIKNQELLEIANIVKQEKKASYEELKIEEILEKL